MSVTAIVLAAGSSQRMGCVKQLLPLGQRFMLNHVISQLLAYDFSQVITVIGYQADIIQNQIQVNDKRFYWLYQPDYEEGQSMSLKTGLSQCATSDVMIFLGDEPFIADNTITDVLQEGRRQTATGHTSFFVRPQFQGVPGHPVYIGRGRADMLTQLNGDRGARSLLKSLAVQTVLSVADWGVAYDIDTPERYRAARYISAQKGW